MKFLGCFLLLLCVLGIHRVEAADQKALASHEIFVDANGSKLFCKAIGKGKPLIVVHGGPGLSQDYLFPQLSRLGENHFVIFYDQRGCGRSIGTVDPEMVSMAAFVDDLDHIRQAFHLDKISLLGHSWGGFLAMHYALAHPASVDKLILSNSVPASSEDFSLFMQEYVRRLAPYQAELSAIRNTKKFAEGNPDTMEQFYRLMFRPYCYLAEKAELLNLRMSSAAHVNGGKMYELIREKVYRKPFDLHASLTALSVPTLIIHGDADPIPAITAEHIHQSIPGSKYLLLKNCGHFSSVEQPALFFNALEEFLGEERKIVRRAAFDIGSGKIKMQVSDVDLTANKIAKVLLRDQAILGLRGDLEKSLDGRLSGEIQNKTIDAISALMKKAALLHPDAYSAVATEAFRIAKNAPALLERIKNETGLGVVVVSQEEEGILGFISAVNEVEVDPDRVVCCDFGGGSFQITAKCNDRYSVYQGKLGKNRLKNMVLKIQGKEESPTVSPNPISKAQATKAIQLIQEQVHDLPAELRQTLNRSDLVVLGVGNHPLYGMPDNAHFDKARVLKELDCRLNLDDKAIQARDAIPQEKKDASVYVVLNLIQACAVMEALKMTQIHYVGTPGANAVGALLSPQYWKSDEIGRRLP